MNEAVIKNSTTEALDQMASQVNFTKHSEMNEHLCFPNYFIKFKKRGRLPNSFYEVSIIPVPNQIKTLLKKKITGLYP